jgi:hypothetical protein
MTDPTQGACRGEYGRGEYDHARQTVNRVGENDKVAKKQALRECFLSILANVKALKASMTILAKANLLPNPPSRAHPARLFQVEVFPMHQDERRPRRPRNYQRELAQRAEQADEPQPGDELIGQWPKLELEKMNQQFRLAFLRELRGPKPR